MAIINYINTGSGANSGDGDSLRTAFTKINLNFDSLVSNFVAAGVTSWNNRVGIVEFTNEDLLTLLGYTPYPNTNPDGFVTSSTISLSNYAKIDYVNTTFVFVSDLARYNFASTNYVDLKLTEYPTLTYLDDQQYLTSINLPNFLTSYITDGELATFGDTLRDYTTTTVFEAVNNTSIIPSQADTFNLGEESFRWSNLYLANAVYIQGIGISVDPSTGRLLVDGNDILANFLITGNGISKRDQTQYYLSNAETAGAGAASSAWISIPGVNDVDTQPLQLVNTGTAGVVLISGTSTVTVSDSGIEIIGDIKTPIRISGNGQLGTLTDTNHYLEFLPNEAYNGNVGNILLPQRLVSSVDASTYAPIMITGSRVSLYASTFTGVITDQFTGIPPAYLALDDNGLHLGRHFSIGAGEPTITDSFEGYKLPLGRGVLGQVLGIVSTGTALDSVDWVTPAGGAGLSLTALPSSLIPNANLAYDLGSSSNQWRSLYIGTSTIYLGGTALSVDPNGSLTINGNTIGSGSSDRLVNGNKSLIFGSTGTLSLPAQALPLSEVNQITLATIDRTGASADTEAIATAKDLWFGAEITFTDIRDQDAASIGSQTRPWAGMPSYEALPLIQSYGGPGLPPPPPGSLAPAANTAKNAYLAYKELASSIDIVSGDKKFSFENSGALRVPDIITKDNSLILVSSGVSGVLPTGNSASINPDGQYGRVLIRTDNGETLRTWQFGINGALTFPDGTTSTGAIINVPQGSSYIIQTLGSAQASPSNVLSIFEFGTDGSLTFPDDTAQTTAWTGSVSSLVNNSHTFSLDTDGSLNINNSEVTIATNNWGISAGGGVGATEVVYTAKRQDLASIKVHATIEGVEDGDATGQHSQACDMMIVRRVTTGGAVTVDTVVYGVIYTSSGPLATLDAQWNAVLNRIEITATPTSSTNNIYVKVYATEVARGD
jgi:hypothetical protein